MRSTRTYALVTVSQGLFDEVKEKLVAAGYQHALHESDSADHGEVLDMHGLALTVAVPEKLGPQLLLIAVGDNQTNAIISWRDLDDEARLDRAERSRTKLMPDSGLLHSELDAAGHDITNLQLFDDRAFPHHAGLYLWSGKVSSRQCKRETISSMSEYETIFEGTWRDASTSGPPHIRRTRNRSTGVAMHFLVLKRGVYIQDVHGPFSDKEGAAARAQQLAEEDYDDYHEYQVATLTAENGLLEVVAAYRKFMPNRWSVIGSESALMWSDAHNDNLKGTWNRSASC